MNTRTDLIPEHSLGNAAVDKPLATAVRRLARDDFDRDVWCVLGAPIDLTDLPQAVTTVESAVRDGERLSFVTPNVNWLVRALKDAEARRQIIDADLSLADGAPIVALAKLMGAPIAERVAGSDLFEALRLRPAFGSPLKVFFFGGRDGAAEAAHASVNADQSGLVSVGWLNPGFGDVEAMSADAIIDEINAADPDFIVVSLGAAKGQAWIDRNQNRLTASAIAHLGAVVDFTAGTIERAPRWMANSGLEWLWRIKAEPSLWKRYAGDAWALFSIAVRRLPTQLRARPKRNPRVETAATVERTATEAVITLAGDITRDRLETVRAAFREAAAMGVRVRLDLKEVGAIDRAFLGLVLMLEKHATRAGNAVVLSHAAPNALRLFRANAMDYRLVQDAGESMRSAGSARAAVS